MDLTISVHLMALIGMSKNENLGTRDASNTCNFIERQT